MARQQPTEPVSGSLLFVVGARPNFVKIAPLCRALSRRAGPPCRIVHTGQHYDPAMSDVFFEELGIPAPDFFLKVGSGGHGRQTGEMMIRLEALCRAERFAAMVVIGDVNSTLAGSLVGAKLHLPVAHVESGLRSFNRAMPEEINRVATDHISDLLFAPTRAALDNLRREGLAERSCFSGDVMYDMILEGLQMAGGRSSLIERLGLSAGGYYLATLHRPYNVDEAGQLTGIMDGLSALEEPVLLSAHPRLRRRLGEFGIEPGKNVRIAGPFGYLDFILLEKHARKVITDSGGVQKEAFFVQTPCVTLRPETEWMETVEAGANILVRERTREAIVEAVYRDSQPRYEEKPYGNGRASEIILDEIRSRFKLES